MFNDKILLALNHPINSANHLLPKSLRQLEEEAKAKKDEEESLAQMSNLEKKRFYDARKKQEAIKADMETERLLTEEMDFSRRRVNGESNGNLYFERLNGFITLEGHDQDYEVTANFNEITLKPLKNQENRLAFKDLILTAYGRNISKDNEAVIRSVLGALRPQIPEKKELRTRESVT